MPEINVKYKGLTDREVRRLREKFGTNELVQQKKETILTKILEIMKEPMFILLGAAAVIYFLLGEHSDGAVMISFVVLMIGINIFQEWIEFP